MHPDNKIYIGHTVLDTYAKFINPDIFVDRDYIERHMCMDKYSGTIEITFMHMDTLRELVVTISGSNVFLSFYGTRIIYQINSRYIQPEEIEKYKERLTQNIYAGLVEIGRAPIG